MKLQQEKMSDCIDEMIPLLQDHYSEIARNQDFVELDPNYDQYQLLDESDMLHVFTARDGGKLIGYVVTFLAPNLHYKTTNFGLIDILFLKKEYRGRMVGYKMIKSAEESLKTIGVQVLQIGMKLAHDFGPMLERMGYTEIERTFEKVLRRD